MIILIRILGVMALYLIIDPVIVHARYCSVTQTQHCDAANPCPGTETCITEMKDYCITPAFITAGVKPNLLLMIDNSASMYDLAYTDPTTYNFCANSPATTCATVGGICAGDAICKLSVVTSTTTTSSPKTCTTNAECNAILPGDTCNTGKGQCKNAVTTVTVSTTTPKSCTTDAECGAIISGDTCNNKCVATTRPCLDDTYSNTGSYPGYFKQDVNYCYSTKSDLTECTNSGIADEFDGVVDIPATCTYGGSSSATPYVCVNSVNAGTPTEIVDKFVASGRFLNWLAMSKFDIEKSILTGGKYRSDLGVLIGESRGCAGRKFIKTLPGLPALSFAIRGGEESLANTSQATQYGQSYIEIYKGTYNESACAAAMNDWQSVVTSNLGPLQGDTKCCLAGGTNTNGCNPSATELVAANQAIHDCFWYFNGHGLSNQQPLKNVCQDIWATKSPSSIISSSAGDAICSNALSHAASENDGGIGNTTGYMGLCFTGGVWNDTCALIENKDFCQAIGGGGAVADPSSESIVPSTVQNIPGFVMELGLGSLKMINDYTGLSPVPANATKGFPLAVYDPGNYITWPPQGLIQKHQENIRFGVMTFQENGSGSECNHSGTCSATTDLAQRGNACTTDANCPNGSCIFDIPCVKTCQLTKSRQCYTYKDCPITGGVQESCVDLLKRDGGKILTNAYLGAGTCSVTTATHCIVNTDCPSGQTCISSIGDHDAGLLRSIDDIAATSWTPFAEGYYNAIGYLARDNAYGAAIVPLSRTDANFNSLPSPDTALSYVANKNPSQFRCQSNNLLLITDGMSTADTSSSSEDLATLYASQVPYNIGGTTYKPGDTGYNAANNHGYDSANKCPSYSGSRSVNSLAWIAKNRNIKTLSTTAASTTLPETASESITTYVVYSGPQTSAHPGLCDPKTLMNSTAENGGTTLLSATNPSELYDRLDAALSSVAAKAASGTAASILSNSEGSGANMLQAVFYPKKIFDSSTAVGWIGEMQNLWYYVDPYVQNSTIREDTDGDLKLNLVSDYVTRFMFDNTQDKTMVQLYSDSNGDGVVTDSDKVNLVLIDPDYVKSIWRAGMKLWARNDDTSLTPNDPRTIYTGYNSTADSTPTSFSNSNLNPAIPATAAMTALWNDLEIPAGTESQRWDLTTKLISYIRGTDQPDDDFLSTPCLTPECEYRKRKVIMGVCSSNNQKRCTTATVGTDCPSGNTCTPVNREWKLGDIISSTPRVQSTVALNTFNRPPSGGYSDKTYESFINSNDYKSRGMVYVGANDGMLHAFNLGTLSVEASGFQKASLTPLAGAPIGAEKWAFIPKNSLPYLKHTANKNYSHLYFIDGRTVLLDASIGDTGTTPCDRATYWECAKPRNGSIKMVDGSNNLDAKNIWRTIVIGAMGLGGASRNNVSTEDCTEGATGNCVRTPSSDIGYSSYFALDVTNPLTPKFLWEFSHEDLGYSTTAPAIIRVGSKEKNGRWFAVFGNGPFGPIDTGSNQFKGQSHKHLRFFVVDLRTGDLVYTLNDTNALGIDNAFAGAMLGAAIDADRRDTTRAGNYQDDAFYAGYVKKAADNTWTDGGVVRIMTKEDINPANWVVSKVIDGIGPVTTAIARTQDTKNRILWLFFGTGRYFYRDSAEVDDNANTRSLFGIQEPCYNTTLVQGNALDSSCTDTVLASTLVNQSTSISTLTAADKGWRINLDEDTTAEGAERVVTDTVALTNGTVFFTTFKPTMDICGYGGNSFLWGVKYDTGGQAAANALHGKALIQLSTGEFKEVDLSEAFGQNGPDDPLNRLKRRMASPMTGKPPSDAPPIVSNSMNRAVKKILHIQEH